MLPSLQPVAGFWEGPECLWGRREGGAGLGLLYGTWQQDHLLSLGGSNGSVPAVPRVLSGCQPLQSSQHAVRTVPEGQTSSPGRAMWRWGINAGTGPPTFQTYAQNVSPPECVPPNPAWMSMRRLTLFLTKLPNLHLSPSSPSLHRATLPVLLLPG